ncbi:MAG: hypothetical protein ACE5KV_06930 [Thermoplasmata archaeon]
MLEVRETANITLIEFIGRRCAGLSEIKVYVVRDHCHERITILFQRYDGRSRKGINNLQLNSDIDWKV